MHSGHRRQPASIIDDIEEGEDIPNRADDGYLQWRHAKIEVRGGRASLTLTLGGFRLDDAQVEVLREAIGFWVKALG